MSSRRCLKRQPKIDNLRAAFSGISQVSTNDTTPANTLPAAPRIPVLVNTVQAYNPATGNRTVYCDETPPPSPSTSAGLFHPWPGTTTIHHGLRKLEGFPYQLQGSDSYADSEVFSSRPGSPVRSGLPNPLPSVPFSDDDSIIPTRTSPCCALWITLRDSIRTHRNHLKSKPPTPPEPRTRTHTPYTIHHPTAIAHRLSRPVADHELVLIYHRSQNTTLPGFLEWFLGFYDVRHDGRRVRSRFEGHGSGRIHAQYVADCFERGVLRVANDGDEDEIMWEVIAALKRLG